MAFTFVKTNSVIGTGTSMSVAFPTGGNTAGNFLVYITANYSSAAVTLTDTLNTPVQEFRYQGTQNTNQTIEVWTVRNCAGGANTVMQSGAGSHMRGLVVLEYSGDVASGLHATSTGTGITTTPTTGTITPTVDGCLIVGGIIGSSAGTPYTPDVEYTEQADINGGGMGMHVQAFVQALAAAISSSPTPAAQIEYASVIVAFAPAPATYEQVHTRWRTDDGSETTATWAAAEDTGITAPTGVRRRLRVLVDTADVEPSPRAIPLEYKKDAEAESLWRLVGTVMMGAMPAYSGTGQAAAVVNATITTAVLPARPSTVNAGDCLILQVLARNDNNDGAGPATISGWTAFAGNPYGGTNNSRQSLYWRIAGAGEASQTVSVTCTGGVTNDLVMARIYRFTAANGFAPVPIEAIATNAGTASPLAAPANVTPTGTNRLAVCLGALASSDATIGSFTGESAGNWTEAVTGNTTTGGDGTLNVQTADASAGTAISGGSIAFTLSTSAHWNTVGFCLVPAVSEFILSASANIAPSGENTTAQLTPPAGKTTADFGGGRMQDDEVTADAVDLALNDYGEWEWSIEGTAVAQTADVYQFRARGLDFYTALATWTIGTPPAGGSGPLVNAWVLRTSLLGALAR